MARTAAERERRGLVGLGAQPGGAEAGSTGADGAEDVGIGVDAGAGIGADAGAGATSDPRAGGPGVADTDAVIAVMETSRTR